MIAQKHVPPDYCTCGIHGRLWAIYCTSTQCSTVNCFHRTLKLFPIWIMKGFCWSSGYVLMGLIKSSPYLPEQRCCQLLLLFFLSFIEWVMFTLLHIDACVSIQQYSNSNRASCTKNILSPSIKNEPIIALNLLFRSALLLRLLPCLFFG